MSSSTMSTPLIFIIAFILIAAIAVAGLMSKK